MSKATYPDEKQVLGLVDGIQADGSGSTDAFTALIAEGENLNNPICSSLTGILFALFYRSPT